MPAYTSSISDVHKSYGVEKLVLHHLIFLWVAAHAQLTTML